MSQFIKETSDEGRVEYHNISFISQVVYDPVKQNLEITVGDPAGDCITFWISKKKDVAEARKILDQAAKFKE